MLRRVGEPGANIDDVAEAVANPDDIGPLPGGVDLVRAVRGGRDPFRAERGPNLNGYHVTASFRWARGAVRAALPRCFHGSGACIPIAGNVINGRVCCYM